MAPNFVFNGRSYRKNLTKTNATYYKFSNCDRGCPLRLIVRNNEISEKCEGNCKANRLVIQISATNRSRSSLNYARSICQYSHLIEKYGVFSYQRTAGFNRNEFDRSSIYPPLSLLPNNQPFFVVIGLGIFIEFNIK
ncbi:LOW QUALITY PROTEIN: hypothetical protein HZS_4464 [Henneguya salminicola]|nr:LOW QUALITY PROTEIN: hypothetical protein HZS_4464 [Henneguya salminicola]